MLKGVPQKETFQISVHSEWKDTRRNQQARKYTQWYFEKLQMCQIMLSVSYIKENW